MEIIEKKSEFEEPSFWEDGRVTQLTLRHQEKELIILNGYFPNGNPRADGREMLPYKLAFYESFRKYLNTLKEAGKLIITTGDFNICHHPIDIARPEENKNSIGFLPIEREEMDKLQTDGYIDVFRYFYPEMKDKYTWWSYRSGARERNV